MKKFLIIIVALVAIFGFSLVGFYNRLVGQNQAVESQWAQVETQYQRRYDLIPNLVNSVEGIMDQEQEVFGQLAEARARYGGAASVEDRVEAANQLESALGRLLVIVENYPELRSSESVATLMDELAGTENRVSVERRRFNELVQTYNVAVKRFPANVIAGVLGFDERPYFEAVDEAETAPSVQINP